MNNLIRNPDYSETTKSLRASLFDWIRKTEGDKMLLKDDGKGARFDHGYRGTY